MSNYFCLQRSGLLNFDYIQIRGPAIQLQVIFLANFANFHHLFVRRHFPHGQDDSVKIALILTDISHRGQSTPNFKAILIAEVEFRVVVDDPDDTHLVEMAGGGGLDMEKEKFSHVSGAIQEDFGSFSVRFGDIPVEGVDDTLPQEGAQAAWKDDEDTGEGIGHRLLLNRGVGLVADDDIQRSGDNGAYREPESEREEIPESRPAPKSDMGFSGIQDKEAGGQGDRSCGNESAFGEIR